MMYEHKRQEQLEFLQYTFLGAFLAFREAGQLLRDDKIEICDYNAVIPVLMDVMEVVDEKITALGGVVSMQLTMSASLDVLKLDEE